MLNIKEILLYIVYVLIVIGISLVTVISFIGLGYSALNKIVEPSFDIKNARRWIELLASYLLFSVIFVLASNIILKHFVISLPEGHLAPIFFFPPVLYLITRATVRFISARIAKDFLLSIVFIILVGVAVMLVFLIIGGTATFSYHIPVDYLLILLIMGIPTVFIGDIVLYYLPIKVKLIGKNYLKDRKLIDLTDKLPVTMENIVGTDEIDKRIESILRNTKETVKVITRSYTTIHKNLTIFKKLLERRNRDEEITIKIIGGNVSDREAFRTDIESRAVTSTLDSIKTLVPDLHICQCKFDKIRLILRDSQEAIVTFSTGNSDKSHIGLYSSHPLFISLLENYFDAKCKTLPCPDPCDSMCKGLSKPDSTVNKP